MKKNMINIILLLMILNPIIGETMMTKKATIGGGCFWCIDAVYRRIDGVINVVSGYAGGNTENPTYYQVSEGYTGHAEVVQIEYDPAVISYQEILDLFFRVHDPTTLNRQGADVGTQYRSIILYHDEDQRELAEAEIEKQQEYWDNPIVTELVPLDIFYMAEDYHQDYYTKNPASGYCRIVIRPKLDKLNLK